MVRAKNPYEVPPGLLPIFSLLDTRLGLASSFQYSGMFASINLFTPIYIGEIVIAKSRCRAQILEDALAGIQE